MGTCVQSACCACLPQGTKPPLHKLAHPKLLDLAGPGTLACSRLFFERLCVIFTVTVVCGYGETGVGVGFELVLWVGMRQQVNQYVG